MIVAPPLAPATALAQDASIDGHQDDRQGVFSDDEDASQAHTQRAPCRPAALLREMRSDVAPAQLQPRKEADEGARQHCHGPGKRERSPIDNDYCAGRRVERQERHEQRNRVVRQHEADTSGDGSQHETINQETTDAAQRSGPERDPDGELARPIDRAGQVHARDVHRRDEKEHTDGREQQQERGTSRARNAVQNRHARRAGEGVRFGERAAERPAAAVDLEEGRSDRCSLDPTTPRARRRSADRFPTAP